MSYGAEEKYILSAPPTHILGVIKFRLIRTQFNRTYSEVAP